MSTTEEIEQAAMRLKRIQTAGVKLRVLLPADSYLIRRICNNMPKGTQMRIAGTAVYEDEEWQVCEFFKPKTKHEQNTN